ncbi:Limonene synthase [Heracleum sosnowskyi]|uniref:Limonene synthase n=1 Tax=Heracleum sosnowskyi TaxID=360622 RepID=A0AAD8HK02_9APIA|nr:Limonene synthase [Heracleum sosnowskyi]
MLSKCFHKYCSSRDHDDVVQRWDINAMKELPDYMKLCFLSLINVVNETTYDILKDHNIDTFPHQKKWFNDLFERYIVEARWYNSGYQPTLEEYLKNGFVSIGGPIVVLYSYICTEDPIKKEDLEFIEDLPDIVRLACEIFRLSDDYGTSSAELKRGDVPSSIQCYMVAHCLYNAGDDGYGVEDVVAKDTLVSLLVEPIPL